jgi:AAA+ ATPase superfamily predicted ATPase
MQTLPVIGRNPQKQLFEEALNSSKSEFMVVYGRRRVGKTFLIKNVLGNRIDFEMTGIQNGDLIDRADGIINLCEVKFSNSDYKITPDYKQKLRERAATFSAITATRKSIFSTLITTYGLSKASTHLDVVQNVITLEDLFLEA